MSHAHIVHYQQLELVHPLEEVDVSQCVSGIRVAHEKDGWELTPYFAHDVKVPARLDLDLDALISSPDFLFDLLD
jgi:hypothetical protein